MAIFMIALRLLIAFFIYIDAKKRGHEMGIALFCAVGSAVIPIVGLPLYFLFGRKGKLQEKRDVDGVIDIEATVVEETTKCANCGNEIAEDLLVCPYCNHTVTGR